MGGLVIRVRGNIHGAQGSKCPSETVACNEQGLIDRQSCKRRHDLPAGGSVDAGEAAVRERGIFDVFEVLLGGYGIRDPIRGGHGTPKGDYNLLRRFKDKPEAFRHADQGIRFNGVEQREV